MSFDMSVWDQSTFISFEDAVAKFAAGASGDFTDFTASGRLEAFAGELFRHFPDLDTMDLERAEDPDDPAVVWSEGGLAQQVSTGFLGLAARWSRAADVRRVVTELARAHDVLVFNQSEDQISYPPHLAPLPFPVLGDVTNPLRFWGVTETLLRRQLDRLNDRYWFVVLDRDGAEHYAQVAAGPVLASQGATFPTASVPNWVMEIRDGNERDHFRTELADLDEVRTLMTAYLSGDESWRPHYSWERLRFD